MFGEDGWCHSCGVPRRDQCGQLVLQRKKVELFKGAWLPHWQYDAICLDHSLGEKIRQRFTVELREIAWPDDKNGPGLQVVVHDSGQSWFDPDELSVSALERHGVAGNSCTECGVWKWMPLMSSGYGLPRVCHDLTGEVRDVVASAEWFGDGLMAFRQVLVRRDLATLIAEPSPRDVKILEVTE